MSPARKEFLSAWLKAGHWAFDHRQQIKTAAFALGGTVAAGVSKIVYDRMKGGKA